MKKTYRDFDWDMGAQNEEEGQIENHGFEAGLAAAALLVKGCADNCDKAWSAYYDWRNNLEKPKDNESHLVMVGLVGGVHTGLDAIESGQKPAQSND